MDNDSYNPTISYNSNNHRKIHRQLLLLTLAPSRGTHFSNQQDAYNKTTTISAVCLNVFNNESTYCQPDSTRFTQQITGNEISATSRYDEEPIIKVFTIEPLDNSHNTSNKILHTPGKRHNTVCLITLTNNRTHVSIAISTQKYYTLPILGKMQQEKARQRKHG